MDSGGKEPYGTTQLEPAAKKQLEDWRSANVPRLLANSDFCRVLEALRKRLLRSTPQREREFTDAVPLLASLAVQKLAQRESYEQLWANKTGMTWKALTAFPRRLKNMAAEIEQLNGSPLFGPERGLADEAPEDKILKRFFSLLPDTLRTYAAGIEAVTQKLPALTSQFYWTQRGHSPWVGQLSELVNRITGSFHDKEVAELLNAAGAVLNPNKQDGDKAFDAQTLADLRSRRKRKAPKT